MSSNTKTRLRRIEQDIPPGDSGAGEGEGGGYYWCDGCRTFTGPLRPVDADTPEADIEPCETCGRYWRIDLVSPPSPANED